MMASAVTMPAPQARGYRLEWSLRANQSNPEPLLPKDPRLLRRFAPRNDRVEAYLIGQIGLATAACAGKMVTNLPPTYCSSTGSASLFWPISSNFTRYQGIVVC